MKNVSIWLVFFTMLMLSSCQQKHTEVEKYPNGNLKKALSFKGDQYHGACKWYYQNENLKMVAHYDEGKLHGEVIRYYYNGDRESYDEYDDGKRSGQSITYYTNGNKKSLKTYTNDTLDGKYRLWYRDGQMKISGAYQKGLYQGKWVWWSGYGTKTGEATFRNGDGTQISWHTNGKKQRKVPYKNNLKHGQAIHYNPEGEVVKILKYDSGKLVKEQTATSRNNL